MARWPASLVRIGAAEVHRPEERLFSVSETCEETA
jgi:hypothetical protein